MDYKPVVVDSSVFVAFYNESDSNHEYALLAMSEFETSTLIVHPYVIQEVVTVLTYRFSTHIAKKFLTDISRAENIIISGVDAQGDILYFNQINKKISFTDATLVNLAQNMNALLLTFDKQMLSIFKRSKK